MPRAKPRQPRQHEQSRVETFIRNKVLPANDNAAREVRETLLLQVLATVERVEAGSVTSALGRVVTGEHQGGVANGINHAATARDRALIMNERYHRAKAATTPEGWAAITMLAAGQSPRAIYMTLTGAKSAGSWEMGKLARIIIEALDAIATAWAERHTATEIIRRAA